jgi:Kef-type K+ transport system membrane component KefB
MSPRLLAYELVLATSVAAVASVVYIGERWYPLAAGAVVQAPARAVAPGAPLADPLAVLLAQLLVIVAATRAGGWAARRLHQPAVIGEIAAGLLLGPSLLGMLAPGVSAQLFPAASLGALAMLSQLGVILFMFGVGLDVDVAHLRRSAPIAVAVSHCSIVVPFVLGTAVALALFPGHAPARVPFHAFGLFMGIAMSITAFPVLARILEERGLTSTPLGATALACAAVDDLTAWALLAAVVALVTSGGALATLATTAALVALFLTVAFAVVKPWLARISLPADDRVVTTRALVVLLAGALATEAMGLHALFGAFVAGTVQPMDAALRRRLRDRLQSVTAIVLLPAFFAFTGLRTEIGRLDAASWLLTLGIIAVATAGKLVGTIAAARWSGAPWGDSFSLGALMNTRGLMELVALNVGYELGILGPQMFTMLVVMALATTAMTGPLLDVVERCAPANAAVIGPGGHPLHG